MDSNFRMQSNKVRHVLYCNLVTDYALWLLRFSVKRRLSGEFPLPERHCEDIDLIQKSFLENVQESSTENTYTMRTVQTLLTTFLKIAEPHKK